MSAVPKSVRYKLSRYVEPDEIKSSILYGEDKYSLMFDILCFSGPREGEYRVSLGTLGNHYYWATFSINRVYREIVLEVTYLQQQDVEDILQALCNEFCVNMVLTSDACYMVIPVKFEPGEEVLREV